MQHIGPIQKRLRKFSDKCKSFWTMGMYEKVVVFAPFLLFWFLRKMVPDKKCQI
jgi:hypothetical protein